jgi:acetate kinase
VRVLVLNAGSATLKATVLDLPRLAPVFDRSVDWRADGAPADRSATIDDALATAESAGVPVASVDAVGHRVVHGGRRFTSATRIDDAVVADIEGLADLAPLHQPVAVETIRHARQRLPDAVHVASFDTAFHATLPETDWRYPVPDAWWRDHGIRRYGFHGLSVAWSTRRAAELLGRPVADLRLVVAHLGGGASVTAVDGGRSVHTSMGLTPLEGLMMGSRSGSIDPGAILRLARTGMSLDELDDALEHRSGLRGVSARTDDMKDLLEAAAAGDQRATLAIAMYVARAAAGIAAAATHLPAVDAIVFTGGIGEHAATVRERIVDRLRVLGTPEVLAIGAREDVVIAEEAAAIVSPARGPAGTRG